jgi:hypothetical protein
MVQPRAGSAAGGNYESTGRPPRGRSGIPGGQDMHETSGLEPASSPGAAPAKRERGWHPVAVSAGTLGPPIGLGILHPVVGEVFVGAELAVLFTIIGTTLFGSRILSERAFRLLRWLGNRPEPRQPPELQGDDPARPGRGTPGPPAAPGQPFKKSRLARGRRYAGQLERRWQRLGTRTSARERPGSSPAGLRR